MCAYISNYLTILDLVPIPTLPVRTLSSYGIIQVSNSLLLYNKNIGTIFEQEDMIMHLAEAVAAGIIKIFIILSYHILIRIPCIRL